MKSDDVALQGKHVFEAAGLGKAPFRLVGVRQNLFDNGDGTQKPGGTCDYCYTGILFECLIKSADGRHFVVGTDCVERTGDAGIIKAYKTSQVYRDHQAELRKRADEKVTRELNDLLDDPQTRVFLTALPHPNPSRKDETLLDHALWMRTHSGAKGRKKILQGIRAAIATHDDPEQLVDLMIAGRERQARIAADRAHRARRLETLTVMRDTNLRQRRVLLDGIADLLADGRGHFRDSVADVMRRLGEIPRGRARAITLDIVGKAYGRAGSTAYENARDMADRIFDQADQLIDECIALEKEMYECKNGR